MYPGRAEYRQVWQPFEPPFMKPMMQFWGQGLKDPQLPWHDGHGRTPSLDLHRRQNGGDTLIPFVITGFLPSRFGAASILNVAAVGEI